MKIQSTVTVTAHDVQVALSAYILAELGATAKVTVTQVEEHGTTETHYTIDVTDLVLNAPKAAKTVRTGVKRTRRTKAEIEAANAAESTTEATDEVVEANDPFAELLAPEAEPTAPSEFSFA